MVFSKNDLGIPEKNTSFPAKLLIHTTVLVGNPAPNAHIILST